MDTVADTGLGGSKRALWLAGTPSVEITETVHRKSCPVMVWAEPPSEYFDGGLQLTLGTLQVLSVH
jgi:hypothetical protein